MIATLHRVLGEAPVPPRQIQPGIPRPLERICLTCLEKDPGRRYASASDLARALEQFLGGQGVDEPVEEGGDPTGGEPIPAGPEQARPGRS